MDCLVAVPSISSSFYPETTDLVMSHLVGINKGPVMDWTNDSGLDECFRKWKYYSRDH